MKMRNWNKETWLSRKIESTERTFFLRMETYAVNSIIHWVHFLMYFLHLHAMYFIIVFKYYAEECCKISNICLVVNNNVVLSYFDGETLISENSYDLINLVVNSSRRDRGYLHSTTKDFAFHNSGPLLNRNIKYQQWHVFSSLLIFAVKCSFLGNMIYFLPWFTEL